MTTSYRAPSGTDIGHVHLKVADLQRAIAFYRDVLGFDLTTTYGDQAAFLSAGGSSLVANWAILGLLLRISDQARRPAPVVPADALSIEDAPTEVVRLP